MHHHDSAPTAAHQPPPPRDQPPDDASSTPEAVYRERLAHFTVLRDEANRARYRAANTSAVLFVAALATVIAAFFTQPLTWLLALTLGVGFLVAFAVQANLDDRHRRYATLCDIAGDGLHRLRRDWQKLPLSQPPNSEPDHLYAADLDLLGHASLQHLLSVATPAAQLRLQRWLLHPAAPATIRERQPAVAELASMLGFRDELSLFGRLSGMTQPEYTAFLTWAEQEPWLTRRPLLLWISRLLPVLTLASIIAQVAGVLHIPLWPLFVAINLTLTRFAGKSVDRLIDQVSARQGVFQPYAGVFQMIAAQTFASPLLRRLQADLAADDLDADFQMRRLGRIMWFADLRLWYLFVVIQSTLLWDFHVLWALERWQRDTGRRVRVWLETLSELETLSALAALAFEHPTWTYPDLAPFPTSAASASDGEPQPPLLVARDLGHPLLPPDVCVGNDVTIGPPGSFLLVTGSNMSGKSTLLRAIGVNVVLAQMGAPVCAAAMRLPPIALATSVRVQDSLEYGVSYYMAELRKLKRVVDDVQRASQDGERMPLFLLDEILHGTNTAERQIAARRVVRHLLALGATGVVSTHDLTLADDPALASSAQQVHFTEAFTRGPDGPSMTFDYRLRPGLATSSNALKLMEIVGLSLDLDPDSD